MKIPVVIRDDYTLYLEDYLGFWFIHCDCSKWTKTVKRSMHKDLIDMQREDFYAIHEIGDKKHEKFLRLFDFEYLEDFVGADNKLRQRYVRRL